MRSFIGNLIFAAILLLVMARFLSVFSGTAFPVDIVSSNSMSPSLMEGDLIAWTPATIDEIQPGDVIVFKSWISWPDTKLVVHRVIDIKQQFGRSVLETKGDANDWTDQSGPHIPEPYVSEKNLIGKILTVGNVPIKVPFIGLIGIWINEGFRVLSQPSAAKGMATNVGVFTPLMISVILLVISIFILPEKAKTIRERLRVLILGSQPLKMKSVFSFFFTIFVILLVIIHLFAFDSITASVGVGEFPEETGFSLGSVSPGYTTSPKPLPVFNLGIIPVKGIIFGTEELHPFVDRTIFQVDAGSRKEIGVTTTATNGTINGSYVGTVMVYSSPLFFMFPDSVMKGVCGWNGQMGILILDVISAFIFTILTVFIITTLAFLLSRYQILDINLCWHYAPRNLLKHGIRQRMRNGKTKIKTVVGTRIGWISQVNIADLDPKPLILATVIVIPLLFLLNSEFLALIIASLGAGLTAYLINCQLRRKIILASTLSMIFSIIYISVKTNYFLFTSNRSVIESMGLGMGAMGLYLLVLAFFLVPFSLFSWLCSRKLRNLKEQKDPLLVLEGRCDL